LRFLTLWFGYRAELPAHVVAGIRERLLSFKYWYTDPTPSGVVDHRWYWSENHRLIFHCCEYLAGGALPDERFEVAGLTGSQHQERAAQMLSDWFAEKAQFGFSEWHSDAYYEKDLAPLVTLAEFASDGALRERAAASADLVLTDLALHSIRDNTGSTHGRSYMRFKATAPTQTVFGVLKLCFDRSGADWPLEQSDETELLPVNEGPTLLARCRSYRPPDIVRRIARHPGAIVDREGMGVMIDPSGPPTDQPTRSDGLSYTDPAMVPFWWDKGALTPWQLVPLTLDTLDRHRLWDTDLFRQFREVRDVFGDDRATTRQLSADLHPMINAGLLSRVDTYTWRNQHVMLSTAQSYRPGCVGYQHHIAQATIDEYALVFTNHPGNGPGPAPGDYRDDDRYWTGTATLPRSVQHGRALIEIYSPAFSSPEIDVLSPFAYCDHTHAYFPTERFDEVVEVGRWTVGRRLGGFIAVWSWRPVRWRVHDPDLTFTNGLRGRFDLIAEGGPDNVWVIEVGDVDEWGDLAEFCAAVTGAEVEVEERGWAPTGEHRGFDVRYASPAEGLIELGPDGPLRVAGRDVPIGGHPRFDNPFVTTDPVDEAVLRLRDAVGVFVLDLGQGTRRPG
jgi:hypothetical protein